eukprot:m.119953 g.119953  ORF g.119953 m.119953 type:complete len:737 (+) comp9265_c1_seq1:1138-3348(+)
MSLQPKRVDFVRQSAPVLAAIAKLLSPDTKGKLTKVEWHLLFQDVYVLCTALPEALTVPLHLAVLEFLRAHVRSICEELKQMTGSALLRQYRHRFAVYVRGSTYINDAFRYFNQNLPKSDGVDTIEPFINTAMAVWRDELLAGLGSALIAVVFAEIEKDRSEPLGDELWVVRDTLLSLVRVHETDRGPRPALELYKSLFLDDFLHRTSAFYKADSAKALATLDCAHYLKYAEDRLQEESHRAAKILHDSSIGTVREACEAALIREHVAVVKAELSGFFARNEQDNLRRAHRLLQCDRGGRTALIAAFEEHLVNQGKALLPDLSSVTPDRLVEAIGDLHRAGKRMASEVFSSDQLMMDALSRACRAIVNRSTGPSSLGAELLARYCDTALRKKDAAELNSDMFLVFGFLEDKDVFQKCYIRSLARRLVHMLSASFEAEEQVISRLRKECGSEYTNKMQRMFTDIALSETLNAEYADYERTHSLGARAVPARYFVLQTGAWPIGPSPTAPAVPALLSPAITSFETFYKAKFFGRKLCWLHHVSTADVRAVLGGRFFEFKVTIGQLAVLMQFVDADELPADSVMAHLNAGSDSERVIASLVAARLLTPTPASGAPARSRHRGSILTSGPAVTYALNTKYSNKHKKVKLTTLLQKESSAEIPQVQREVDEDRNLFLQAAIVRIMKARKEMNIDDLMREVVAQCKGFAPHVPQMKKCIEILIEKEYLRRQDADKRILVYVA